ncbi:hypothetical protein [Chryseobacterium sp.]|uniref:hypothetical protein n=1 Tax=Chryseobacterium sp. TaxID=1871047 RepID=UPI0028983C90|nr:hypothetical protein [Chryseobacterium sp.]
MKKNLIFLLTFVFGIFFSQSVEKLHGRWKGKDESSVQGSFTFFKNNFVLFEIEGVKVDGRKYEIPDGPNQGKIGHVKYEVDFTEKPYRLDIVASIDDNNEKVLNDQKFLRGFIEFKNENEMLLQVNFSDQRLEKIDPKSPDTILLIRDLPFKE